MPIFDTHAHYDDEAFDVDRDELLNKLLSTDIDTIVNVGASIEGCRKTLNLAKQYKNIYAAIGVHPDDYDKLNEDIISWLKEEALSNPKVVAIGEIGLDYHYDDTDKEVQRMVFNRQLEIAEKFNKPVVVHSRDSIQDTYNILKEYNLKGSIHCFSGSLEMAKLFTKLGYKLGVGGIITFKNAKNIKEVVKNVDLSYILLETDSPYLSPEPYRGNKNDPSNIPVIAESIASIKGVTNIDVARVTTANAEEVFDFL